MWSSAVRRHLSYRGKSGILGLVCAAIAIASTHVWVAAALGSTANADINAGTLSVTAPTGEANQITLRASEIQGRVEVVDTQGITAGSDCELQPASTTVAVCRVGDSPSITVDANDGADSVYISTDFGDQYTATVQGGAGHDFLRGGVGADTLDGGPDTDEIWGGDGEDDLDGEEGSQDFVWGQAGNDIIDGGPGDDYGTYDAAQPGTVYLHGGVVGGAGNDTIRGGSGWDLLRGGADNDSLDPGEGDDLMGPYSVFGEEGDDVIVASPGADWMSGGPGTDTVSYADRNTAVVAQPDGESTSGGIEDGADPDWRDKLGDDIENLTGGSAGDTLTGNALQNTLTGNGGGDTITGLGASDSLLGGAGPDTLNARDGVADTVNCGSETDTGNADGVDTLTACEFLPDTDADGVPEASDACPLGAASGADHDGDGCKDEVEDADDDNDGVSDSSDPCQFSALSGADTDGDGCKDAGEDSNDDADPLPDSADSCDTLFAQTASGCPDQSRILTIKYSAKKKKFSGDLTAPSTACRAAEEVTVMKSNGAVVGTATTSSGGSYVLKKTARRGKYFATVPDHVEPDVAACAAASSQTIKVK